MDVDPPIPHPVLKRCCSAPMISECETEAGAVATSSATASLASAAPSHSRTSPTFVLCSTFEPRTRRFSASFSPLHSPTPGSPRVPPSRVSQLKKEEACDAVGREVASEKEFQSTLQISASWEDLSLSDTDSKEIKTEPQRRPSSACTEPIHVTLPNGLSTFVSSPYPSPTRVSGRQCFSPSMQIPVRNSSFSPTPSPSPTRKTFYTSRRSLSPIAIRASSFGPVKRKCDLEDRGDSAWTPNKKYQHFSPAANVSSVGGPLLVTHSSSAENGEISGRVPIVSRSSVIPTPDSQSSSASPSDSGSNPSPLQVCKVVDSPANSPGGRRGSTGGGGESSGSRSRDRTSCVVPSPLAATNTIEDPDGEYKISSTSKERKDFSRLFVPIPPSPGAMDCCTGDSEESLANNHHDFSTNRIREQASKELDASGADYATMDENMEEPVMVSSQEHSMSVDSSHSPMDPSV
ncbi:PPP2R1A-PPP2R2A-interacting phosphatase regulator 1 [Daphnia magna]|uniref:Uncharacterized protein n=2 Tax=Daphnia magna TaxID=35525 RepID=A0ABR0A5L7_9CRUS|nr:PPP2R1A-PPP2R2A-interacting phosphatase regulator 1 [Daphnia magna]KAK4020437.1 hypothetical protein OUZ56_002415 [Daphnia magna]KZS15700.1 Protein FAM122A [Daphnia magna]